MKYFTNKWRQIVKEKDDLYLGTWLTQLKHVTALPCSVQCLLGCENYKNKKSSRHYIYRVLELGLKDKKQKF